MVKCEPCQRNKCNGKQADVCADPKNCTCVCHEGYWGKLGKLTAIVVGTTLVAGGVTAIATGGALAAIFVSGVAISGGSSLVTNPVFKMISGEQIKAGELAKDVAVGAVVGVASGGLGAGGTAVARTTTGAARLAVQLGSRSVAGAAGNALAETANAVLGGEKLDAAAVGKASLVGAVGGLVGGASSKVAGSVSGAVRNGVAKAGVRVVTQTIAGAACATGVEAFEAGGIHNMTSENWRNVGASAVTQAVVASTQECARNQAVKTQAFEDRMGKDQLRKLDEDVVARERQKLRDLNRLPGVIDRNENRLKAATAQKQELIAKRDSMSAAKKASDVRAVNRRLNEVAQQEKRLAGQITAANDKLSKAQERTMIGENRDVHFLKRDLTRHVAVDHPKPFFGDDNSRGLGRSVFVDRQLNGQYEFVGQTDEHKYNDLHKYGKYGCQQAFDAVTREQMKRNRDDDDDDDDDDNHID